MFRTMVLVDILLLCSFGFAQSPSRPEWRVLADDSTVILVGVVVGESQVVRRDQMITTEKPLPDGKVIVELANPSRYVVGRIFRLRVDELIKNNGKIKTSETVNIFLPGWISTEGTGTFAEKQRDLVFLSPLKEKNKEFAGTTIYRPGRSRTSGASFIAASSYVLVQGENGKVEITEKTRKSIDEVKAIIRH